MNEVRWKTLRQESRVEYTDKKSLFIARAKPILSVAEATDYVAEIRGLHPDATHNVYAWRLQAESAYQKYSDDGEPGGTAGLPVLDVLRKGEIDDAVIVVTRYFGGTLLGTGGLVRAYGRSASLAVQAARPIICRVCPLYAVLVSYSHADRLLFALAKAGYQVHSTQYEMDMTANVYCELGAEEDLITLCTELTAGQAMIERIGEDILREDIAE